jgi:hypothetical protein
MQPFSRETILERRHPVLHWTAVFAGAAAGIGVWLLLQLLGTGVALATLDAANLDRVHTIGIGTTAWSLLAMVIAMFLGGALAGRLAGYTGRRTAALHGALVWALTAIVGFVAISGAVALLGSGWRREAIDATEPAPRVELTRAVAAVNARLRLKNKPTITEAQVIDAAQASAIVSGYDRDLFVTRLDARSPLTHDEIDAALRELGDPAPEMIAAADRVGQQRARVVAGASAVGSAFLIAALALALGLVVAIGGALFAARELVRRRRYDTEPTLRPVTAPYPVPPTPADIP